MADSREPLGSGIVTLIVVDAVLVLIFLVMLLQFLRADVAGAPRAADGTPTTTATSTGDAGDQTVAFTLPSRNITCTIGEDATRCAIAEFTYAPPNVEGCSGRTGHEIELTVDGARWLCTAGAAPGRAGNDVGVLDYGDSTTANGFTCRSSEEGVDCRHEESGHSFSLARAGATLD
jgi:hypothetical protein